MEITMLIENDVTVIHVAGDLDTQTSERAFDEMTRMTTGSGKVLLDLEKLDFLSSAGLRALLRIAKQIRRSDGTLKLCNASGFVKEVIEISGFGKILELYDADSDALADF